MGSARRLTHARDYSAIAEKWARDVVAGRIVQGKFARLACKRHLKDLKRRDWGYRFDRWHADDVCDFIEKLPHVEGVWDTPTIRLEPPQVFILAVIFGWRRRSDGLRRFSSVYIEMARKGRSHPDRWRGALLPVLRGRAGRADHHRGDDRRAGRQGVQPGEADGREDRRSAEAFGLEAWARSVTCAASGGFIQPINAKGKTQDGWNPHVGILDELHAHPDRSLFDVITSAFGARRNPLRWVITTAGYNTNGVCYEQRTYVAKILEGVVEADHYFGIVFLGRRSRRPV
jgi:phage terminase large subunit-like protein